MATQQEFEERLTVVEAAIIALKSRVDALEPSPVPGAPAISDVAADDVTTASAVVSAWVEPSAAQAFTWQFEYGPTTSYGSVNPASPAQADPSAQTVSTTLTGLTANTLYHYRLTVVTPVGTFHSADAVFTSATPPLAPTVSLDHTFDHTAVGTGNDQAEYGGSWSVCTGCAPGQTPTSYRYAFVAGNSVTLRFNGVRLVVWGVDDASGATAAPVEVDGQPAGSVSFLGTPGVNVQYDTGELGAVNADHTVKITSPASGNKWISFHRADVYEVTAGGATVTAPGATSNPATGVTNNSATVSGTVTPNGATTTWRFEYGTTTSYGNQSPSPDGSIPDGAGTPVDATLTGLASSTLYHYRLKATNSAGTTNTADRTFTTTAVATTTQSGRITRSGKQLRLNGKQYKFVGANYPFAVGCAPASMLNATTADRFFGELGPRSMTRIWVMPTMSLAQYDLVFNAAKAHGQYLCVTLLNGLADCTSNRATYGTPVNSSHASWVQQVVSRHAGQPTVAMYECANEASESNGNIVNWYAAMAALIKQYDPQALVGTGGGNVSGNASAIAAFSASANIDLISYHDYYKPPGTIGPRAGVFENAANIANKPWYMGERGFVRGTGYDGGDTGNIVTNAQRMVTEFGLFLARPNCAGYLYWDFRPSGNQPTAEMRFGNALWTALCNYDNSAYNGS